MRLIFKPSIVERMRAKLDEAYKAGRDVEAIVLTDDEYREYRRWIADHSAPSGEYIKRRPIERGTFFDGIPVFKPGQAIQEWRP